MENITNSFYRMQLGSVRFSNTSKLSKSFKLFSLMETSTTIRVIFVFHVRDTIFGHSDLVTRTRKISKSSVSCNVMVKIITFFLTTGHVFNKIIVTHDYLFLQIMFGDKIRTATRFMFCSMQTQKLAN